LIQRGTRLPLESDRPIAHIAADLGIHSETLRTRVRQAEADSGARPELLSSSEREEIRRLRKENYELRRANEILKSARVFFARELDPDRPKYAATSTSIVAVSWSGRFAGLWACRCRLLPPSDGRPAASLEDERLLGRIRELHAANYYAYGSRRMWIALRRAGEDVGRGRVERLMRRHGICGAKRRGKPWRTTRPDPAPRRRPDLVDRDFTAAGPNQLWVADITYLALLGRRGVLRVHHRRLQPPDRRLAARRPHAHHARARRPQDGLAPARRRRRRFKTELIADRVRRSRSQLELAVVEYLGWFNTARLHQALGDVPPAEFEALSPRRDETITSTIMKPRDAERA
jgi:putative transposase